MRRRRCAGCAVVVLTTTLTIAACGDDDSGADDAATTSEETDDTEEGSDTTSVDTTAAVPAATDDEPDDTTSETTGEVDPEFADYCGLADELNALSEADDVMFDPEQAEEALGGFGEAAGDLQEVAPDEIADDVEVLVNALSDITSQFEEVDYNVLDLDVTVFRDLANDDVNAAGERVNEFDEEHCGAPPGDGAFEVPEGFPESGTFRDYLADEFQKLGPDVTEEDAQCLADAMEPADLADMSPEREQQLGEECGVNPQTGEPVDG